MAMIMKITVFCDVTPCSSLVGTYQHFKGTCCVHIQGRRAGHVGTNVYCYRRGGGGEQEWVNSEPLRSV
jgi:hypothetical protein